MMKEKSQLEIKEKPFYKNMGVYVLHRSMELDHEQGRPSILLKYRTQTSLVWWGTHKIDVKTKEKPFSLTINKIKTYFYSKGIEKVATFSLKEGWIDFSQKHIQHEAKEYILTLKEQQSLISKFASFTFVKDPFLELTKSKERINQLVDWIKDLQEENASLRNKLESKK